MTKREMLEFLLQLPKRPVEAYDRLMGLRENRQERTSPRPHIYQEQSLSEIIEVIGTFLNQDLSGFLKESELAKIEAVINRGVADIPRRGAFTVKHNASFTLGHICYALCRALKPAVVLETGVAYGVSSSFILAALAMNGKGALYSADLPPTAWNGADQFVGKLIPADLRDRWHLYRGASKRIFPKLLPELGKIDLFIHDSLHTYQNMLWEFQTVTPYLSSRAAVVSDDIDFNAAFADWVAQVRPACWGTARESDKRGSFGVSIFTSDKINSILDDHPILSS